MMPESTSSLHQDRRPHPEPDMLTSRCPTTAFPPLHVWSFSRVFLGSLVAIGLVGGCLVGAGLGCGSGGDGSEPQTGMDASQYFPLEVGRYWVLFNPEGEFLTLELTQELEVVGVQTVVLTFTRDRYPKEGEPLSPIYEQYYRFEAGDGIRLYGFKDYESGAYTTYLPGLLFAGTNMALEVPYETSTAASGTLATFVTTLAAEGIAQSYYGDFGEAIDITLGREGEEAAKHFLGLGHGWIKFDWKGSRYQLYDYGAR